jgi:predicted enzyme related to lactoylglutathione lyase
LPGWSHYALLRSEAGIAGAVGTADSTDAAVLIYIEVDDPPAYIAKAERLGATVVMPVTHVAAAQVTVGWLRDPQGNLIGVVQNHESG